MKILLAGCRGQVGWEICRQAPAYGFELIATSRDGENDTEFETKLETRLDITDIKAIYELQAKHQFDIVINAAAYTAVDKAESDEAQAYQVNAIGAQNLAVVAAENNLPILHISTDYIFKGDASLPYTDDFEPDPQGVYGRTKLKGEILVAEANSKHLSLRTSWVFGSEGNNFVKTMLRLANERDELSVVTDQLGSPTFAGHIARALLELSKQYNETRTLPWGTYNFCDSGLTTWHMFATKIMQIGLEKGLISKIPIVHPILSTDYPTPASRPHYSGLDCARFLANFPHIGIQSWEDGLYEVASALQISQKNN